MRISAPFVCIHTPSWFARQSPRKPRAPPPFNAGYRTKPSGVVSYQGSGSGGLAYFRFALLLLRRLLAEFLRLGLIRSGGTETRTVIASSKLSGDSESGFAFPIDQA